MKAIIEMFAIVILVWALVVLLVPVKRP